MAMLVATLAICRTGRNNLIINKSAAAGEYRQQKTDNRKVEDARCKSLQRLTKTNLLQPEIELGIEACRQDM